MKRMAVKAMLGVVGVLSLVVTTRALGVTYVVPIQENSITLALQNTDVTEVLVRSDYTEYSTVHMKSGVPVRRDPDSSVPGNPTISVTDASAVIFPSETTSGTVLEGFDIESSGFVSTVDCDSAGDPAVASQIRDCTIVSDDWNAVSIGEHSAVLSNCDVTAPYFGVSADSVGTSS